MREGTEKKKKWKKHAIFFCPQAPVPGTRSPVPLPCLPSTGVPVPLRLPKRGKKRGKTHDFLHPQAVSGTRPPVPQGKTWDILCPQAPVPGTRSPVPPPCLPSTGVPVPLRLPKSARQKKKTAPVSLHPPGAGGRGAQVPPGRGLYLTPFARCWVLAGVDVVWMLSCVLWSLF